jgi:UDPglucose--hexose-1-phosphate uridylyltransferase
LASLGSSQARKVIDVWAERTEALLTRSEIEYVLVFENRGREVGATIDHPHGQIYGYPLIPPTPAREARRNDDGCYVCDEVALECASRDRIVTRCGNWVAWVPFAAAYPYEMRFAPRDHVGSFPALNNTSRDDLARLLVDALGRYDRLWGASSVQTAERFPYLLWFHQAPRGGGNDWHLHAHAAPPLRAPAVPRFVAAGELGSGTPSNPVVPENAAKALREA